MKKLIASITLPLVLFGSSFAADYSVQYEALKDSFVTVKTMSYKISPGNKLAPVSGCGAGFFYEPDKLITAKHNVDGNVYQILVGNDIGHEEAKVLYMSDAYDIAVLQIAGAHAPLVKMADTPAKIGAEVLSLGMPYCQPAFHVGNVTGLSDRGIMMDAVVNPGASGGPVFNAAGEVIGMTSFILSKAGGFNGVAYAVPLNKAFAAMKLESSYIGGFTAKALTVTQANLMNYPAAGLLIQGVYGGVAVGVGFKEGKGAANMFLQEFKIGGSFVVTDLLAHELATVLVEDPAYSFEVWHAGVMTSLVKAGEQPDAWYQQ